MKKIVINSVMFSVLLLSILFAATGCMYSRNEQESINESGRGKVVDEALALMEQKYGGQWVYTAPWGNSMSGTRSFFVRSESFPGWQVLVQVENFLIEDRRIFRDNFLAVKYEAESVEFFHSLATNVFPEAKIHYRVATGGLSPELPPEATFREFLADTQERLTIIVEVKSSSFSSDEQINKVAELFAENIAHFFLRVVVVDDNIYDSLDRDELSEQIVLKQFVRCADITNRDGELQIRWL